MTSNSFNPLLGKEYFMRQALAEAKEAQLKGEIPVGAVVVFKERVIARGHNQTETLTDVTAHAEMIAITAAAAVLGGKYLKDCTLYVTLEPCIMCAGALGWSQIGEICYAASDPKRGYSLFSPPPLHPKTIVSKGVLEEECAEMMRSFFANKRG